MGILALCAVGHLELVSSDALVYESEKNLLPVRREHARAVLSMARSYVDLSDEIKERAERLTVSGLAPMDALHLAFAEEANAEYFCTCDDRLLRRAKQIVDLHVKVVSPIELVQEIEQ
ncbi:MAG: hypothetical protein KatS3mg022_3067 [Armatimonadota bacterium]|nr:MAG: hypothetical protein KatS3mg022_3067 [Armatimonadota bacterium]